MFARNRFAVFVFVSVLNPPVPKMRRPTYLTAFLDGVNVAAVAVVLAVLLTLTPQVLMDWKAFVNLAVSSYLVFGPKNSIWCG